MKQKEAVQGWEGTIGRDKGKAGGCAGVLIQTITSNLLTWVHDSEYDRLIVYLLGTRFGGEDDVV